MYVNCDYYRVFYYVAKYGSLSQAARLLLAGQPNLTRAIRNLEAALGCPLFTRSSRGMRLTPEGERLYAHIRVAFEHIEAGEAELAGSRSPESGTVFLAASEVALRCLLLPVLREYRRRFPGVHLRISNHGTAGGQCRSGGGDDADRRGRRSVRNASARGARNGGLSAQFLRSVGAAGHAGGSCRAPADFAECRQRVLRAVRGAVCGIRVALLPGDRGGDGGSAFAAGRGGAGRRVPAGGVSFRRRPCPRGGAGAGAGSATPAHLPACPAGAAFERRRAGAGKHDPAGGGHTVKPACVACALRCRNGRSVGAAGKKSRRTHDIFIFPPCKTRAFPV